MKRKSIIALIILLLIMFQPITAYADMGPKPCIYVKFENIGNRTVYASFYALDGGPSPVSYGDWEEVPEEIQKVFLDYSVTEEARFVEDIWIINEEKSIMECGYMPPDKYKLVVYIPEENEILESDFYTRDRFEEKYITDISQTDEKLILKEEEYNYSGDVLAAILRVILTVIIELAIAFLFMIRGKKSVIIIVVTNVVTQLYLNINLLMASYRGGGAPFNILLYFIIETVIFFVEAFVYIIALRKVNDPPIGAFRAIAYALVANLITFIAGLVIG